MIYFSIMASGDIPGVRQVRILLPYCITYGNGPSRTQNNSVQATCLNLATIHIDKVELNFYFNESQSFSIYINMHAVNSSISA